MGEARKLAAILVSDVVGYSRLAGADEDRILARLRALRSDLIDPIISVHHGRIVKRTGDGSIIEFRSVVDAVRCAIEVQTGMVERNAGLPPEKRIEFRIGIHLGDVVEEADGDLMGDGVNIAARLEAVAQPGSICLSEDAYRQVSARLEMTVADLGPTHLKNIDRPIRVYALQVGTPAQAKPIAATKPAPKRRVGLALAGFAVFALVAAAVSVWRAGYAPRIVAVAGDDRLSTAPRLSIVVLPFGNLSGDKEQDYFADAITEDLTTDLSHLQDAFVISRATAFTYKGKPVDPKQIGKDLGVRYALEGSVRRTGEAITINAQLISTETGAQVWADRFDGMVNKLGELQVEAVSRLANSLGVELVKAESLRALRERPNNPDATDLSMRGWAIFNANPDKKAVLDAATLFERTLALDPQNVSAMFGLVGTLTWRLNTNQSDDRAGDIARAEELANRALALQPHSSMAHWLMGYVFQAKHQWGPAIAEAEAAIAEDPNNADAYAIAGFRKTFLGRTEDGFAGIDTALRLSPRDPMVPWWQEERCELHANLAQWEKAIDWCSKSAPALARQWFPYMLLAAANAWAGHMQEARDAAAQLQKLNPSFTVQSLLVWHRSDNPTYNAQEQRIAEGLRKAGGPEGEKKTD